LLFVLELIMPREPSKREDKEEITTIRIIPVIIFMFLNLLI
jgi:hypothetical protein